jgi:hypothetical protein
MLTNNMMRMTLAQKFWAYSVQWGRMYDVDRVRSDRFFKMCLHIYKIQHPEER